MKMQPLPKAYLIELAIGEGYRLLTEQELRCVPKNAEVRFKDGWFGSTSVGKAALLDSLYRVPKYGQTL